MGSGKSLTFEIAPFVFKFLSQNDMELSTVIVVSPLVALMQYQAAQLTKNGVRAVYLQDAGFYTKLNVWGSLGINFEYDGGPIIEIGVPSF